MFISVLLDFDLEDVKCLFVDVVLVGVIFVEISYCEEFCFYDWKFVEQLLSEFLEYQSQVFKVEIVVFYGFFILVDVDFVVCFDLSGFIYDVLQVVV